MSALQIVALVAGILLWLVLLFAVVMIPVRRRALRMRSELREELGEGVARSANVRTFGLESRGAKQMRGNGWLVLTGDELRFRMWVPDRETRIPLASITAVETPRGWLGKTTGRKLLCVRWRTPEGAEDAMAWEVPELDAWLAALRPPDGPAPR